MAESNIDHLYQSETNGLDALRANFRTGITILSRKITRMTAAKSAVAPLVWSKSKAAGMPRMLNRGSNPANHPLSVSTGIFLRLKIIDVNQEMIKAIKTITAKVFGKGDLRNMLIIILHQ
jgi:hypothetical protein